MRRNVRFIILTRGESFAAELRPILLGLAHVKIVAEVDEPAMLAQAVHQFPADVVLVNLDPAPDAILPIIGDVAAANRELVVFAASDSTDGQLILKAMRSGVKEFLPKPIDLKALTEAIERVAADQTRTPQQGRLITMMGSAGGMGSTFLATNLAAELKGIVEGQVTVADLDYRYGQVATFLDLEPTYTVADLCGSPEELDAQVIGRALCKHTTGLQVLSRPNQLAEADNITAAACVGVLSHLVQMNDYVVVDGPTRFDIGAQSILSLSDVTFIVVQQLVPSVRNALRVVEYLRNNGFNLDRAKLLCNRTGRGNGHLSVNDVKETVGLEVFATIPEEWETTSGAINLGEPLVRHSPKSKVRLAIQEIAQRLHSADHKADEEEKDDRKQGLIGRIFAGN